MKKVFLSLLVSAFALSTFAQTESPYRFKEVKNNIAGATEDQCATGTCWSFATISFLESEVYRKTKKKVDLSEMYNVRMSYPEKVLSYVLYQGKQQLGPGGLSHDVINVVRNYGMMPESAYSGFMKGQTEYDHSALDAIMEGYANTVLSKKLNANEEWKLGIHALLDTYIGAAPIKFDFEGKAYTPATFRDAMGIDPNEYVSLTSFTHHPFYSSFVLEVPDNWSKGSYYNLPLNELKMVIDYAIDNGFTIAWDADVSERYFDFGKGIAIIPADTVKKENYYKSIVKEKVITQENRQAAFESLATTDDHLMHITGKATDQNGNVYYITKNSWGAQNPYGGYQYVSESYLLYKTVGILIPKDAIPADLRKKLGL